VHDRGIENDHASPDRRERGQHRAEDARVDDRGRHRAALIDAEKDVALRGAVAAAIADAGLRDDGAILRLVMLQVRADGAMPVDLVMAWAAVASRAVQAAD